MKFKLDKSLKLDKLLKNKTVLFITFFLSLVTIFGYLVKQNYTAILFFTLVLFLTKHFSSNMIIILGVSIITTNLLDLFRIFSNKNLEGMQGNKEEDPKDTEEDSKKEDAKKEDDKSDKDAKDDKSDKSDKDNIQKTENIQNTEKKALKRSDCPEGTDCKTKSGMTNIKPAALSEVNNSGSGNIDVFNNAKMKETAFDNLDKMLGSDSVRNLKGEANSINYETKIKLWNK